MRSGLLPNLVYSVFLFWAVLFMAVSRPLFADSCGRDVVNSPTFFGPGPGPAFTPEAVFGSVAPLLGPVKIKVRKWKDRFQLIVDREDGKNSETVISATLAKLDRDKVAVKWLEINALQQQFSQRQHRGLPIEVFKHLKHIVMTGLKAEGFRYLIAAHPNSFSIANLYLRHGFKPIDKEAEDYYKYIVQRYAQAREFLPAEFKPKNFADFEFILRREHQLVHSDYLILSQKAGIRDNAGNVFAVTFKTANKQQVFLLDKNKEGKLCQLEWGIEMQAVPGGYIRRAPHLIIEL